MVRLGWKMVRNQKSSPFIYGVTANELRSVTILKKFKLVKHWSTKDTEFITPLIPSAQTTFNNTALASYRANVEKGR